MAEELRRREHAIGVVVLIITVIVVLSAVFGAGLAYAWRHPNTALGLAALASIILGLLALLADLPRVAAPLLVLGFMCLLLAFEGASFLNLENAPILHDAGPNPYHLGPPKGLEK